ncbi:hypothetical protein CONPUDRAFT_169481 [Coniophora puteana RWD-64-598 SS2]|uniref:CxC5 like cysteine cluster associated with KDZ domain-containing protein n=1 Tax=Coniophora puteana (strain RWD-64-598) TaxID=741705 RepID=A0A5M3M9Y2_CONPW|nr:uncharacterized protein CONPUDRAFT_169481 [Coniophora puteana RWD-64-598 SS2]EIW75746.1 hypothetical protein CONPUDRAFT_169481 [Coniophora puteana RWD-64-598 SS2]
MSSLTLGDVADLSKRFPELGAVDPLSFMKNCRDLRDKGIIPASGHDDTSAPLRLLPRLAAVLSRVNKVDAHHIDTLWDALRDEIWRMPTQRQSHRRTVAMFETTGWEKGITYISHYPPSWLCTNPECDYELELRDHTASYSVTFTIDDGVQYSKVVNLTCPRCRCNYRRNFYADDRSKARTYYKGVPDYIQVGENHYVEKRLAEIWTNDMLVSQTSATNLADLYHETYAVKRDEMENDASKFSIPFRTMLTADDVWNAILVLALLRDRRPHNRPLAVAHAGEGWPDFADALRERNERFQLFGQPELRHCCTGCMCCHDGYNNEGQHIRWKTQVALTECAQGVGKVMTMRPCGIVLGCSTLIPGADDATNAIMHVKNVSSLFGALKPEFWMYTGHEQARSLTEGDEWWDSVDICCPNGCMSNTFCELRTDDGKDRFETRGTGMKVTQWLDGYREIMDGMSAARCNFFLDEMVRLRNANMLLSLRETQCYPSYSPLGDKSSVRVVTEGELIIPPSGFSG